MQYWLLKSEPFKYSWSQLLKDKRTSWDGVRNFQAASNLRSMKCGDQAFFYHSNEGKEIVGIVEITKESYRDPSDETGKFVMVDVKPIKPMTQNVPLSVLKSTPSLSKLALIKQSRLSVTPITASEWKIICKLGGL
jgi:predicted RNA-binding protein with PUA-like domain